MSKERIVPDRIRLSEALERLEPFMSKSNFYGTSSRPGPRWTMVSQLDIRKGPPITLDRRRFYAWLETLRGELAVDQHPNAMHLGDHARRATDPDEDGYADRLVVLCRALDAGRISRSQFERAVADLEREPTADRAAEVGTVPDDGG